MSLAFLRAALVKASVCLAIVGCAQQAAGPEQAAPTHAELRRLMDAHLDGCTQSAGIDPTQAQGVGDFELAANERAWLDCAYEGIETIMVPNSYVPDLYRRLIAESRALTNLVERGEVSREQRRTRIDNLLAEIEDAEITGLLSDLPELSEDQRRANEALIRGAIDDVRVMTFSRSRL